MKMDKNKAIIIFIVGILLCIGCSLIIYLLNLPVILVVIPYALFYWILKAYVLPKK
jgi:4-hydroxybenzoate polyprenyltransferase